MKPMERTVILLLALLCATACHDPEKDAESRQALLIYFAGNNSLSAEGVSDYTVLLQESWLPGEKDKGKIVLVYKHFSDQTPVLCRLSKDRRGNTVEEIIREYPYNTDSASPATLKTVIADAERAWPAYRHGLILWSHASGFLPPGYYASPKESAAPGSGLAAAPSSFAEDHGSEMDLGDLRQALSAHHYDFLIFDCCLMANIEVAYELRDACDYLVFSPTEILSDGFPYETMLQPMFSQQTEAAMRTVCKQYMDLYLRQSGLYRSATITLVRTAALEALATACRPVFQNHQEQILTLDRSRIQPYFRFNKHWFYDLDDFVGRVADDSEYRAFISALDQAVIYKDATEQFLSIDIKHYSGLSTYIPRDDYTVLNNYYKSLAWNRATGLVQ